MFGIFKKRKKQFKPLLVFKVNTHLKDEDIDKALKMCHMYGEDLQNDCNYIILMWDQENPIEYDFHY